MPFALPLVITTGMPGCSALASEIAANTPDRMMMNTGLIDCTQLGGICLVAGLGGKDHRDGSLAYYFSEPVVCNDAKGVGPLVLAYTEMIAKK